jgi:hypothetical protein
MEAKSILEKNREVSGSRNGVRRASARRLGVASILATLLSLTTCLTFASTGAYAAGRIPTLGAASPYAILGVSSGTSTGLSTITGDLGLTSSGSSGASISSGTSGLLGTGPLSGLGSLVGTATGETVTSARAAASAERAAANAFQMLAGETPTHVLSGAVLNDATLPPGVYAVAGSAEIAGRLLLDARGNQNAEFVFQIPSDLTTAVGARVILGAGVRASNVIWQVGDATDLASATNFAGTILSERSISLGSGSTLVGRALSLTSVVNLANDSIALPPIAAVGAVASKVVAASGGVAIPATPVRVSNHAGVGPSLGIGAKVSLPHLSLQSLGVPTLTLPTIPTIGSSIPVPSNSAGVAGRSLGLPFIPFGMIGIPELAVPVLELPTLPVADLTPPPVSAPTAALPFSATPVTAQSFALPLIPLGAIGVPALAVPTLGLPTLPISGLSLPTASAPTVSAPVALSSVPATGALSLPLSGISPQVPTLPSSAPSGVTLPGASTSPSSSSNVPTSNALPLPLSGISIPHLTSPLSTTSPLNSPSGGLSLPALNLPSITSGGVALPHLSVTPEISSGNSALVHPRVKESSTHASASPHSKSAAGASSARSATIPVGAPQTGFGGLASSNPQLIAAIGAFLLAMCAGTLALRSRRLQRG